MTIENFNEQEIIYLREIVKDNIRNFKEFHSVTLNNPDSQQYKLATTVLLELETLLIKLRSN